MSQQQDRHCTQFIGHLQKKKTPPFHPPKSSEFQQMVVDLKNHQSVSVKIPQFHQKITEKIISVKELQKTQISSKH